MTRRRRFIEDMLDTAPQTVVKTRGTTTMNMAFRKISPRGLNIRASLPIEAPRTQPSAIAASSVRGKR